MVALQSWGRIITEQPPTYKPKPEDFRIVDGKLYNALTPTNFIYPTQDRGYA